MFIIKKKVGNLTYYWNDVYERWEGIEDNATHLESSRFDELMSGFLKQWGSEDYSFIKVAGTFAQA